jgi:hypothetical protein
MPRTCSLPLSTEWSRHQTLCQPRFGHQATGGDHIGRHVFKLREETGRIWLMAYVLVYNAPGFAVVNPVLPRDGSGAVRPTALRRRKSLKRAPVHQTQHHSPRPRVGGAAPPGGRRRASRRLSSFRPPRGGLGPARGEFLAPNTPLGPPPVLLAGFWAARRQGQKPVGFCPLGGAHQSAWSLYIMPGHTPRRRWRPVGLEQPF